LGEAPTPPNQGPNFPKRTTFSIGLKAFRLFIAFFILLGLSNFYIELVS